MKNFVNCALMAYFVSAAIAFQQISFYRSRSSLSALDPEKVEKFPSIDALLKQNQEREKAFADIKFPSRFTIKIIGRKDDTFLTDILGTVEKVVKLPSDTYKVTTKDTGKYLSITVSPVVQSVIQIYSIYEVVSKDPRVQYVL